VSSLIDLRKSIGLKPALLEELAADIFMGDFAAKYSTHADIAAEDLRDTLYWRYYGLKPFKVLIDEL
jgi:hypothetical protein